MTRHNKKSNIILTGFMGTGKTSVSRELSGILNMPRFSTDEIIEKRMGITIADIFKSYGEACFRNMESRVISGLTPHDKFIVDLGGGAVLSSENIVHIKQCGIVILLAASPDAILARLKGDISRPLLDGQMTKPALHRLMSKRAPHYEDICDFVVNTDHKTIANVAFEIAGIINKEV